MKRTNITLSLGLLLALAGIAYVGETKAWVGGDNVYDVEPSESRWGRWGFGLGWGGPYWGGYWGGPYWGGGYYPRRYYRGWW